MNIRHLFFMTIALLISVNVHANNAHIKTAMGFYKAMEINRAADFLIQNVSNPQSLSNIEKLKYALILNRNLVVLRDIYSKALTTQQVFLETLTTDTSADKSRFAPLFLSEVYILQGKLKQAEQQLAQFEKINNNQNALNIATTYRAWIATLRNDKDQYAQLISNTKQDDPLSLMALDTIKIINTDSSTIDLGVLALAEKQYIKNGEIVSNRFANYALRIYSHRGEIQKASHIARLLNHKLPSFTEEISQFKLINFYEPSLIDSIASFYYHLSTSILKELEKDKKFHDMAIYYLSDLELITANKSSAAVYKEKMLQVKRVPKSIAPLVPIRQNGHGFMYGKTTRAFQAWEKAVNNAKNNPVLGAEAVLMCIYLQASCPTIVQTARLKAENGRSKRFEKLNTNVGWYFLKKEENIKALRLLENALDRGKADGILMNDPILLLNLAEVYRLNKRFSESLQILFSLGQNFPILRQVQDAVQGEYLFRQRSTGSSNVF